MVGAGTAHGDGTDGTIGAGEATMDMAMDTDGADTTILGITLIMVMVMDMVIMEAGIMVAMATIEIMPITEVDVGIITPTILPVIAQQEI